MISIILVGRSILKYQSISLFISQYVFINFGSLIRKNYIEYTYFSLLLELFLFAHKKIQVLNLLVNVKNIFFHNYKKNIIIIFLLLFEYKINYHLKSDLQNGELKDND